MIPCGIAESPPVSSKNVCQPMFLFKCVAQMSQYPESYPFETTNISLWTIDWDPWYYTATDSGRVVYPYIYKIRKLL